MAQYATHLRNGRVDGGALARVARRKGGAILVDAGEGLAFPACELAVREAIAAARELGAPGDAGAHGIDNWKVTVWRR